jgi:hypothetical protein
VNNETCSECRKAYLTKELLANFHDYHYVWDDFVAERDKKRQIFILKLHFKREDVEI